MTDTAPTFDVVTRPDVVRRHVPRHTFPTPAQLVAYIKDPDTTAEDATTYLAGTLGAALHEADQRSRAAEDALSAIELVISRHYGVPR